MPIYTGTGDEGQTGLFGNERVPKDHIRIEAYGTVDELSAVIGLVRSGLGDRSSPSSDQLRRVQNLLFEIGADLATVGGSASVDKLEPGIKELEGWIDASEAQLPQLKTFILAGGNRTAAELHLARTVSRRAERCYWTLQRACAGQQPVPSLIGVYLNRLSDLLFSWARLANHAAGTADEPWVRD